MRIETFYGAESKQYHHRCLHCGMEIREMMGDQVDMHALGWCVIGPKNMLGASAKHGASLGEHHREQKHQEALRTLEALPNWRNDLQQSWQKCKKSIDHHYHEIMLALMILDVILLTWIAIKK